MNEEDAKWISDSMDDTIVEGTAEFEGHIFMSTDGKLTVSADAKTPEGRKEALKWTKAVYDRLMHTYGSKQFNAAVEYKKAEHDEGLGNCPKCGSPMKMSSKNKPYCSALCWKNG